MVAQVTTGVLMAFSLNFVVANAELTSTYQILCRVWDRPRFLRFAPQPEYGNACVHPDSRCATRLIRSYPHTPHQAHSLARKRPRSPRPARLSVVERAALDQRTR